MSCFLLFHQYSVLTRGPGAYVEYYVFLILRLNVTIVTRFVEVWQARLAVRLPPVHNRKLPG